MQESNWGKEAEMKVWYSLSQHCNFILYAAFLSLQCLLGNAFDCKQFPTCSLFSQNNFGECTPERREEKPWFKVVLFLWKLLKHSHRIQFFRCPLEAALVKHKNDITNIFLCLYKHMETFTLMQNITKHNNFNKEPQSSRDMSTAWKWESTISVHRGMDHSVDANLVDYVLFPFLTFLEV